MGLDMYACTIARALDKRVDFEVDGAVEIHRWRKHPDLQGWMERLYRARGGTALDFNCVNVQLTREDLDALERAVRSRSLPPTSGFFFGQSDSGEMEDDLAFIAKARGAVAAGLTVFYSSWW